MRNSVTNKIKNSVVKSLQLRDLGQLRDRFEGQSYLDQQISKLHSFNAHFKLSWSSASRNK